MGPPEFTLASATALLPQLRSMLEEMALAAGEVHNPDRQMRLTALTTANSSSAAIMPLLAPAETVSRLAGELAELGVVVREPLSGLVDFAAERDGQPVYLCWRLGEDAIGHWHTRDAGFAGRLPL